jgi:hypothetical protein
MWKNTIRKRHMHPIDTQNMKTDRVVILGLARLALAEDGRVAGSLGADSLDRLGARSELELGAGGRRIGLLLALGSGVTTAEARAESTLSAVAAAAGALLLSAVTLLLLVGSDVDVHRAALEVLAVELEGLHEVLLRLKLHVREAPDPAVEPWQGHFGDGQTGEELRQALLVARVEWQVAHKSLQSPNHVSGHNVQVV